MKEVFSYDGAVMVDARVQKLDKVFPMIGPGKLNKEILYVITQYSSDLLESIQRMLIKIAINIEYIMVRMIEVEGISNMTFVVDVIDEYKIEHLTKQLNNQIDVLKVTDITGYSIV